MKMAGFKGCSRLSIPVWARAVIGVNLSAPGPVTHVGPVVLVEARRSFEGGLIDIEHEDLAVLIQGKAAPRNREQFVSHSEEASEGEGRVGDPASRHVD